MNRPTIWFGLFFVLLFPLSVAAAPSGFDPSFGTLGKTITDISGQIDAAKAVIEQPDGRFIVGGQTGGATSDIMLLRYLPDGALDPDFGTGGIAVTDLLQQNEFVNDIALLPDGKIVAVGYANGTNDAFLARFLPDGTLDPDFGTGGFVILETIGPRRVVLQADGGMLLAGTHTIDNDNRFGIARVNADGTTDTTFGTDGVVLVNVSSAASLYQTIDHDEFLNDIFIQSDGKIVACGTAAALNPATGHLIGVFALTRLLSDGTLDATFDTDGIVVTSLTNGNDSANSCFQQPDGKIVAAGDSFATLYGDRFAIARYLASGALDSSFGTAGKVTTSFANYGGGEMTAADLQPDGKILLGGYVLNPQTNTYAFAMARYLSNGSLDPIFGAQVRALPVSNARMNDMAVTSDNRLITTGYGTNTSGNSDAVIARFLLASFSINDVAVLESAGNANFTVTMDLASSDTAVLNYATANGTALAGSDFATTNGTLTFAAGETVKQIPVPIIDDLTDEPSETYQMKLTYVSGSPSVADGIGAGTINDNDAPPTLAVGDTSITEGAGPALFPVTLSRGSSFIVKVNYTTVNYSAAAGSDYTAVSGTLTFAPGETSKTVSVAILDDSLIENTELFYLKLLGPQMATIADALGIGSIIDNDQVIVLPTISIGDLTIIEGRGDDTAVFTVTLSQSTSLDVQVSYATADGTATAGNDYTASSGFVIIPAGATSATVSIPILFDSLDEDDETFSVTLSAPQNALLGDATATATITDDDNPPTVSVLDSAVLEGGVSATVAVNLSGPSGKQITVDYAMVDGTAAAGYDYASTDTSGSLSFVPGEVSKTISVVLVDNLVPELDETFLVHLSNPTNATLGDAEATVLILDNDPPALSFERAIQVEEDSGFALFRAGLSGPQSHEVSFAYTKLDETATALDDYTPMGGLIVIPPGEVLWTIQLPINDDQLDEDDEAFMLSFTDPQGMTLAWPEATVTITDNDTSVLTLAPVEGDEPGATLAFTATLSIPSSHDIPIHVETVDGTAIAGEDYYGISEDAAIGAGETEVPIWVEIINDDLFEADETMTLVIRDANRAEVSAVGTIHSEDPEPVVDTTPPTVLLTTSPMGYLWPPNHKMVPITLNLSLTDDLAAPTEIAILEAYATSSEPDDAAGLGDGRTTGDVNGADGYDTPVVIDFYDPEGDGSYLATFNLRAEREGAGAGRTYTIVVTVADTTGNQKTQAIELIVQHDSPVQVK